LGNEALDAIAGFDYPSLYNGDFSINDAAARELTNYHRRAALDANITFNSSSFNDGAYNINSYSASLNGR
jgi:hypothetical protein